MNIFCLNCIIYYFAVIIILQVLCIQYFGSDVRICFKCGFTPLLGKMKLFCLNFFEQPFIHYIVSVKPTGATEYE